MRIFCKWREQVPVLTAVPEAEGRITTDNRQKRREGPSMMFVIPQCCRRGALSATGGLCDKPQSAPSLSKVTSDWSRETFPSVVDQNASRAKKERRQAGWRRNGVWRRTHGDVLGSRFLHQSAACAAQVMASQWLVTSARAPGQFPRLVDLFPV